MRCKMCNEPIKKKYQGEEVCDKLSCKADYFTIYIKEQQKKKVKKKKI